MVKKQPPGRRMEGLGWLGGAAGRYRHPHSHTHDTAGTASLLLLGTQTKKKYMVRLDEGNIIIVNEQ